MFVILSVPADGHGATGRVRNTGWLVKGGPFESLRVSGDGAWPALRMTKRVADTISTV
jgi:hypothetical protein